MRGGYIFYSGAMEMFDGKGLEYFFAACTAKFSLLSSLTYDKAHRDAFK